jgi:hypothetical protein
LFIFTKAATLSTEDGNILPKGTVYIPCLAIAKECASLSAVKMTHPAPKVIFDFSLQAVQAFSMASQ